MKLCKDGRIWGQNNKEAGKHLGILSGRKPYIKKGTRSYMKRGTHSESRVGDKNPMFGRHHSIEARRKISDSLKGEKSYKWKGGISARENRIRHHIEFNLWREAVFARDNWTCQKCGKWGGRLNAHHIKSFAEYPELRFAIDNGRTLCHKCHKLTENYGWRNKARNESI